MNKSFVPSHFLLLAIFAFNLLVQYQSFARNPIRFFSSTNQFLSALMMGLMCLYWIYNLMSYFFWCKQSEKSIAIGNTCFTKKSTQVKAIETIFTCSIFFLIFLIFMSTSKNDNLALLLLTSIQFPIMSTIFRFSISFLKKKKQSATINKVVSGAILILGTFAYLSFIMFVIMNLDISESDNRPYDTIMWELTPTETMEYKLYNDAIPLTCEDLYGEIEYPYYSYVEDIENTMFLKSSIYGQYAPPQKNSPPEINYAIFEPKFNFVYNCILKELKALPEWTSKTIEKVDPSIFNAQEAYTFYYDDYNREYLLTYEDKIIRITLEERATPEQIVILCEKLDL